MSVWAIAVGRFRRRRGVSIVEFVLTLPIVIGLLLATLEFGWYFSRLAALDSVIYDAVRVGGFQATRTRAVIATEEAAQTMLEDVGFNCNSGCNLRATTYTEGGVLLVEMEASVPYDQLTNVLPTSGGLLGFVTPQTLRARAVMPIVGP